MWRHNNATPCIPEPEAKVNIIENNGEFFIKSTHKVKPLGFHHQAGCRGCGKLLLCSEWQKASNHLLLFKMLTRFENATTLSRNNDNSLMLDASIGIIKSRTDGYSFGMCKGI